MPERRYTGPKPKTELPAGAVDTQIHLYLPDHPAMPGGPAVPEGCPGPEDYRQVMDWLGLSRVVVTQGNAHQKDNTSLVASLKAMGDCARGVAVISGETTDAEIEELHAASVRGARIMDLPGGAVGLSELAEVDARAAAAGWMVAVQFNGSDIEQHYERLAAIRSPWVLDHHGKFFRGAAPDGPEAAMVKRLLDKGNCYFKFAACYKSSQIGGPDYPDIAAFSRVIAEHAPERIVWGTNWPHNSALTTEDYPDEAALMDTTLGWLPNEGARYLALVDNPVELYGF